MTAPTFTLPPCPQCRHRDDEVAELRRQVADLTRQLDTLRQPATVNVACSHDGCGTAVVIRLDDVTPLQGWQWSAGGSGWACPKHRDGQP